MRIKHLPKTITEFDGKKETTLELHKRVNNYTLEIRNMLTNYAKVKYNREHPVIAF